MTDRIMYTDDKAARFVTDIKGWVNSKNIFYGDNKDSEHMARWSGCTHKLCECGEPMDKGYTSCAICREKKRRSRYKMMPFVIYNCQYVYSDTMDEYFYDQDSIHDYCYENGCKEEELDLIVCEPQYVTIIDPYDQYMDIMPEDCDYELPDAIMKAFDELNEAISENKEVVSWIPGKNRTKI